MSYVIEPLYFDAWATCRVMVGKRQVGKFRDTAEAEAYMTKLERVPRFVEGRSADTELVAWAAEAASLLRMRGGKWKRKVIEEEDAMDETDRNLEIPF